MRNKRLTGSLCHSLECRGVEGAELGEYFYYFLHREGKRKDWSVLKISSLVLQIQRKI